MNAFDVILRSNTTGNEQVIGHADFVDQAEPGPQSVLQLTFRDAETGRCVAWRIPADLFGGEK